MMGLINKCLSGYHSRQNCVLGSVTLKYKIGLKYHHLQCFRGVINVKKENNTVILYEKITKLYVTNLPVCWIQLLIQEIVSLLPTSCSTGAPEVQGQTKQLVLPHQAVTLRMKIQKRVKWRNENRFFYRIWTNIDHWTRNILIIFKNIIGLILYHLWMCWRMARIASKIRSKEKRDVVSHLGASERV